LGTSEVTTSPSFSSLCWAVGRALGEYDVTMRPCSSSSGYRRGVRPCLFRGGLANVAVVNAPVAGVPEVEWPALVVEYYFADLLTSDIAHAMSASRPMEFTLTFQVAVVAHECITRVPTIGPAAYDTLAVR